jgi:hypothetical protein
VAVVATLPFGCAVSQKTVVPPASAPAQVLSATKDQLVDQYNRLAQSINSLNAAVMMKLTAGSAYTGVIEQYHEVGGFILAQRPSSIRVIGQAPVVGKNIFDMVSDGETFQIFIPSKGKFLVGSTQLQRQSAKPIENLRPQHVIDAILWPVIPEGNPVLFEQANDGSSRYYVLTDIRPSGNDSAGGIGAASSMGWEIVRKTWFDRTDLRVSRIQVYGPDGQVVSDTRFAGWDKFGGSLYPRQITMSRPEDDYALQIEIKKLTLNEPIAADRFVLQQPPGTQLVHVGEEAKEQQP